MGGKIAMIYFLFGSDTYRSRQKLREIIEEYKKSHKSGLNLIKINFDEKDFSDFKQVAETVSMFDEKKLIILEEVFKQAEYFQDELRSYLKKKKIEDDKGIIVVFWAEEIKPDNKLFQFLFKQTKVQKFELLKLYQLKEWVEKYVKEQGGNIGSQAVETLIDYVGNDLWRMSNELDKLISFNRNIKEENIKNLVKSEVDVSIFNIIDALGQKNKKQALKLIHDYFKKGGDEGYLFNRFVYQFRNLIKVKSGGGEDLHSFVFRKTTQQVGNFTFEELKKIYQKLFQIDLGVKTGKVDIRAALELFVAKL